MIKGLHSDAEYQKLVAERDAALAEVARLQEQLSDAEETLRVIARSKHYFPVPARAAECYFTDQALRCYYDPPIIHEPAEDDRIFNCTWGALVPVVESGRKQPLPQPSQPDAGHDAAAVPAAESEAL